MANDTRIMSIKVAAPEASNARNTALEVSRNDKGEAQVVIQAPSGQMKLSVAEFQWLVNCAIESVEDVLSAEPRHVQYMAVAKEREVKPELPPLQEATPTKKARPTTAAKPEGAKKPQPATKPKNKK